MAKDQTKDEIAQLAKRRYEDSFNYCQPYFDRFLDNYKHYFMRIIDEAVEEDSEAYPFYSQLTIPISYQTVETILPRMFSRLPAFSIQTDEPNDEKDELALKELIRYQLHHPYLLDDPVFLRLSTAAKEMFIAGNAWGSVPWFYKKAPIEEWQPYSPELGYNTPDWGILPTLAQYGIKPRWKLVKTTKTMIDAPVFQHESVFHVLPDPKKKRVSDLKYAIVEKAMTPEEIMEMVNSSPGDFENITALKKMFEDKEWGERGQNKYDEDLADIFGANDTTYSGKSNPEEGQLKVWFMHEPNRLYVVVNEKLTIRRGGNPNGDGKIGLFLMKDIPVPHELYAWGEPDPIKKIEDGITDQTNMRMDSVFYDLLRMWKLDPSALVDGEEFIPEPGTVVQMKDLNGLAPIDTGTTKASAYREYSEWDNILQGITGVTDYVTGQNQPGMTDVAAGIEQLQQAANARFGFKLQLFEQLGLKAMGTMYVQRNLRFFDTPQNVNTEKGGKMRIDPDQVRRIKGNVFFVVDSGSTEVGRRSSEIQKWQTIIGMIGKPPFDNLSREALDEIGRRMLFALGEEDAEKLMARLEQTVTNNGGTGGEVVPGANPQTVTDAQQTLQQIVDQTQGAPQAEAGAPVATATPPVQPGYETTQPNPPTV